MVTLLDKIEAISEENTELVEYCSLCGSKDTKFLFWNFDRLNHLPGKFGLIECKSCRLVRLSPRPSENTVSFYYPEEDYYSYQSPTVSINNLSSRGFISEIRKKVRQIVFNHLGYSNEKLSSLEQLFQPLLVKLLFEQATYGWGKRFPPYKKDGFALDIGCGNGSYLSFLKHHGWKVQGVDLSQKAADVAKDKFDIDVFVGKIEDLPFPPESFDYINMSHVLEHVFDPLETMKKIKTFLKKNGTIYIEVPNYESYSRKISKQYWYAWETPRHLYTFSPENLKELLETAGFEVVELNTKIHNLFAWDNTYKYEEKEGLKSERPFVTAMDKPKLFFQALSAKMSHLFNRSSGDFICCWASSKG